MTVLAHVGGVPLEELVAVATGGAGAALALGRAWLGARLRSRRASSGPRHPGSG